MKEAIAKGFRVTTNSTLFDGADPASVRRFFDDMMELGVESMMVSPGYSYDKAPDQSHFLAKQRTRELFRQILSNRKRSWRFNATPLFFEFLMGRRNYECTPWGIPTYTMFGWQKPCYLLQDGYADTFKELIEETDWDEYGEKSGNPRCANCMVHCGFEPSAVNHTFGSLDGMLATVKGMLSSYEDPEALAAVQAPRPAKLQVRWCRLSPRFVHRLNPKLRHRGADEHTGDGDHAARIIARMGSGSGRRERTARGTGTGVRLSRRRYDHTEERRDRRRLCLRPPARQVAG